MNLQKTALPAWNGDDTYPHLRGAPTEMLAWQFLRRNLAYQALCDKEFQAYPNHRKTELGSDPDDRSLHEWEADQSNPSKTVFDPWIPWAIKSKFAEIGETECFREFGVFLLIHPDIVVPPHDVLQNILGRPRIFGTEVGGFQKKRKTIAAKRVPGSFVAFLFDLSRDISPQLVSAKHELEGLQIFSGPIPEYSYKKEKGPTKPWQRYIWLLDAQDLKYSVADMRALLHKDLPCGEHNTSRESTIRSQLR